MMTTMDISYSRLLNCVEFGSVAFFFFIVSANCCVVMILMKLVLCQHLLHLKVLHLQHTVYLG